MLLIISLIILIIISTWIYMWFQNSALIHILFSTCSTNYHHYANVIKTEDCYHFWTGTNLFLLNCIKGGCFHLHTCPLKKKKKKVQSKTDSEMSAYCLFFSFFFIYLFFICSEFCHTLEWKSHGFTGVPHPDPPSHLPLHPLPLHPLPLGFPSAPGPSACLMHPTWAGDLFHPRYYTCFDAVLLKHPTLSFSHRV